MSIRHLLERLKESDIRVEVKNGKLKLNAPKGKLNPGLLEELKGSKQEIIDFFKKNVQSQVEYSAIKPTEKKEYYTLSSPQERMYFLQQLDINSTVYNMLNIIPLPGDIHREKLETTFKELIRRHESLRTSFEIVEGKPMQRIHRQVEFKICDYNRIDDFIKSFNLARAPLLRVGIIEAEAGVRILIVDMHHIITDGISQQISTREFIALYNNQSLPMLRLKYKDYAEWQKNSLQRQVNKKQEAYWLETFTGEIPVPEFPTDYPRPSMQSFEGTRIFFQIPEKETAVLKQMVLEREITLYMILLSQVTILMSRLSGQEDIVIGTPTAGRGHADLENIIGIFINTLPIRNYPTGEKTYDDFLHEVKQRVLAAFENQDYLFEDLVEKVVLKRDTHRNPLFDVMFALRNQAEYRHREPAPGRSEEEHTNLADYTGKVSRFDMTWEAVEMGNCLVFNVEYCTKLYKETTINRFINYFKRIISSVVETPGKKISGIEILGEEERKEMLDDLNRTKTPYPKDKTIHQLFEEQAREIPDQVAIIMDAPAGGANTGNGRHAVTYKELNQRADNLAIILREKGIKPGCIAGIMMERSIRLIAAMLAILKSGGAYLPLDPKLPQERVKYMLADSSAKVLVTTSDLSEKFEKLSIVNCQLSMVNEKSPVRRRLNNPPKEANSINNYQLTINNLQLKVNSLAYVIYTSGSTGKPKGVMIEHGNVVRLVKNTNFIRWTRGDRLMPTGAIVFDLSTFEIWGPLANGTALYLTGENVILDDGKLGKIMGENNISILHLVPQLFNQLGSESFGVFAGLKYFLIGGDLVQGDRVNELRIRCPHLQILHMYGPTENTTFSTYMPVTAFYGAAIPIGKPIANSTVYIVDKYNKLTPSGVPGQLLVGGDGVARGYLNRPELTAEKFDRDLWDYQDDHDGYHRSYRSYKSYYKTGDMAKWLPDGNIKFLGRIDTQVKIRGQRIELGEIQHHLLKHEGIKEAVVIAKERSGEKFLCAYIVPAKELEIPRLKAYLSLQLPDYMVPSYFVPMESFPLTHTGKIDGNALPTPGIKTGETYTPPGTDREETLCKIWSEVLGIEKEKIGVHDNFFEMGGNSLNLIMLVGKMNKEFSVEMPISQVYRYPTIREIEKSLVSNDFSQQPVVLLNRWKPKKIFCFPDQFGWGYGYGSMASQLEDYSVYAFIFMEEEDRLNKYIEMIKEIQPQGPYVFFGHSAAGRLSLEVTRALESRGSEVSDIIFADCFFSEKFEIDVENEMIQLRPLLDAFIAEWNAEFLRDRIEKKARNHMTYLSKGTKTGKINANIHLIISEEIQRSTHVDPRCWDKLTTRTSTVYNGFGRHVDMLWGAGLEKNIKIIRKILAGTALSNKSSKKEAIDV